MTNSLLKAALPLSLITILSGCGSDDSSSSTGYIQLYNGSYNSPYTRLFVEETERSGADFADVTTRHNYSTGTYDVSFEYLDANDSYITISDQEISIKGDKTQLVVMSGNFDEPTFTELSVPITSDTGEFNLGFYNIAGEDTNYDIYLATDDGVFESATLFSSAQYLSELDLQSIDEGYYTIYITQAGSSDVVYESSSVYLYDEASYVAMIRPSYATEEGGITLDVVTDNNYVTELKHQSALGQLRFINTIDDYSPVSFSATRGTTVNTTNTVASDSYTDYVELSPNSYSVAMYDEEGTKLADNFLMTLEREQSAVGIFYNDVDNGLRMMSVEENLTPSSYSHTVSVVNLIESYAGQSVSDVDVYFTLNGETVDDTSNVVDGLDRYDQEEQVVDNEVYTVYAVYEDNGQQIVLIQQSDMDFTQEGNYILILEHDETTSSGYKMTLERTITDSVE
ncbi:hypothetical protein WNY79_10565 [Pseudoalteromonas sp. AS84]|jgi:hypothetical protein|uniref:hypothetical protein n=1 Tax=Pseudoalteromonas TaxID=53246 RepID=UPI000976DB4A|nr:MULTISPECIES: hypothetical protein [unclassified Pseudoalteromonas]MBB1453523.1 hypothetical protein [Pseudoalteromonas sp. SG43-5]MBH0090769.1 hypothetical protein [Pseudoalteromonas sp. NSLLW218]WMS90184.1 hypothetical protein RB214_13380 [Pseudoalteromonas sp. HL-AS1]